MRPIIHAMLACAVVAACCRAGWSAEAASGTDEEFSAGVGAAVAGFSAAAGSALKTAGRIVPMNGAPTGGSPCVESSGLDFARFKLALQGRGIGLETEFRYSDCGHYPRNDYQPAYSSRLYKGDKGYDLLIATDDGGEKSELVMVKDLGAQGSVFAGRLGVVANDKLRDDSPIDLGQVTIGDYRAKKQQTTGRATLKRTKNSSQPTDHQCPVKACSPPPA